MNGFRAPVVTFEWPYVRVCEHCGSTTHDGRDAREVMSGQAIIGATVAGRFDRFGNFHEGVISTAEAMRLATQDAAKADTR